MFPPHKTKLQIVPCEIEKIKYPRSKTRKLISEIDTHKRVLASAVCTFAFLNKVEDGCLSLALGVQFRTMDPGGILPRRSFTIRTESGVHRRISQEEMQALVRTRIQQARESASRRPREGWVLETPPGLRIERQLANADSFRPSADHYSSSTCGGAPQRAQPTAPFEQCKAGQNSLQQSESRYDETPLLQKHFSWSSFEEEEGRDDTEEEEHDDMTFNERYPIPQKRETTTDVDDFDLHIFELNTHESEEVSGGSSNGEVENQQDEEHHDHGQRHRLSPSHTIRPIPESPVYKNRVILESISLSRSRSASPKRSASASLLRAPDPLSPASNHSASTNSPLPSKKKIMTDKTSKRQRQDRRQAKIESLLRMSLSRVRERAQNELDQMLAREKEQPQDIQKSLSMTTKDIEEIVQETVRKAREAAQEEISELLKESVLRARQSAEQEILNLVEASMSRVKSQVSYNIPSSRSEKLLSTNTLHGDNILDDNTVAENKEFSAEDGKTSSKEEEPKTRLRPPFIETDTCQHRKHGSFAEISGNGAEREQEEARNIFTAGTSLSPLLITESLEESDGSKKHPWLSVGRNDSISPIHMKKGTINQAETQSFIASREATCEWPHFEYSGSTTKKSPSWHEKAFPKEPSWHEKAFPKESITRREIHSAVQPTLDGFTKELEGGMPWHGTFSTIPKDSLRLVDGFPVSEKPVNGYDSIPFWPSGWPAISQDNIDNSFTVWKEHPYAEQKEQSDGIPDLTSDISLGLEPSRVEETTEPSSNTSVASPCIKSSSVESLNDGATISPVASESGKNKCDPSVTVKLESYPGDEAQSKTCRENNKTDIKEFDDSDMAWLESLASDDDIPFDESEATKGEPKAELSCDQGSEVAGTGKDEKDGMHQANIQNDKLSFEFNKVVPFRNENLAAVQAETDHAQTSPVKDDEKDENGSNRDDKAIDIPDIGITLVGQDIDREQGEGIAYTEQEDAHKRGNSKNVKVSFREETSPIPLLEYEYTKASEDTEGNTDGKGQPNAIPKLNKEPVYFENEKAELSATRLKTTSSTCPKQEELSDLKRVATNDAKQSSCIPMSKQPAVAQNFNAETNAIQEQIATDLHPALSNNEKLNAQRPFIRELDPHPLQTIISPLSLPTVYTSDEDGDKIPIEQFTASIRDSCSDGAPSPCRSLPTRKEVVGVFCTNILDAINVDSFESQTITSLRTPSNQTFEATSMDDENSYLTSAVETWMESVAERLEGHTPTRAQRRRRQRREDQQRKEDVEYSESPVGMKGLATEWFWALGEKLDLAVDQINEVLGAGEQSESDNELEPLPLLSEIRRPSFSFSDGEGVGPKVLVVGGNEVAITEHCPSGANAKRRSGKVVDRNNTKKLQKIPMEDPKQSRGRQRRGRSRVKREV